MTIQNKEQIVLHLENYVSRYDSQNQAANSLKGISAATVSQLINRNWDKVKDEMFRNVASQIGYNSNEWEVVETRDFVTITKLLQDAQIHSNVFAVIGEAGSGKSIALKHYASNNKRAHLLQCNEYWNRKYFLAELLSAMGRDYSGLRVAEMMQEVVRVLKKQEAPLIIMDEADKLSDQVLYFFITLYNQLEDHCGIVLVATGHLEKRIKRGVSLNKKGYTEIYSRIGRKYIELNGVGITDVTAVCTANGITDKAEIKAIAKDCEGDMRRVKRKIHAFKNRKKD